MSRRLSPNSKHIHLYRAKQRLLAPLLFTLIVGGVGAYLIFLSSAATPGFGNPGTPTVPVATNPAISQTCTGALNVALVADVSGSIDNPSLTQMKGAFDGLISDLLPGYSAQFSVTEFGASAATLQNFSSNPTALKKAVDTMATATNGNVVSGGGFGGGGGTTVDRYNVNRKGTDWESGLEAGLRTFSTLNSSAPKLLIIATDGDPTTSINNAITQANDIKAAGIHVLAIGIGSEINVGNLETLSGKNTSNGSNVSINTDVITTDFSSLGSTLLDVIIGGCPPGNGGPGNGGPGIGQNGDGPGQNGNGPGQNGSGPGNGDNGPTTGQNDGSNSGPSTSSDPTPTPTPSDDPTDQTVDTPTPTPTPQQAPSSSPTQTTQPTPQPAPKPTAQGTQTPPPTVTPSPFYDGKQFAAGSAPDNLASVVKPHTNRIWLYIAIGIILLLGVGGFLVWQKRLAIPILAKKSRKEQPKK